MTRNPNFNRQHLLQKLQSSAHWDVIIIGGGATGLGIAVDAVTRGYRTLLLERSDFAKGTSSRSTKLVHGGVRYLAQGNIPLVRSALKERGLLLQNAPHLVSPCAFVIPCYSRLALLKYTIGLTLYDALSGRWSFGRSRRLSRAEVLQQLPGIAEKNLVGGVLYYDGRFDDARLAINLAQTAIEAGAVVLNYVSVHQLLKQNGGVTGVVACDEETGCAYRLQAKVVSNATGVFAGAIHKLAGGTEPLLKQSQGVHLVVEKAKFPMGSALMIPKTADGRVLFAIPWQNHVLIGTTDTPMAESSIEPQALTEEIHFILQTINSVAKSAVTRSDVRSVFAGLRPLVLPQNQTESTKQLSRDHKIIMGPGGLLTIVGGKWTTYRKMAEDVVDAAIRAGRLTPRKCVTKTVRIHGFTVQKTTASLAAYGSDGMGILKSWSEDAASKKLLHPKFAATEGEVLWAVHNEMARTVEDVLARRLRFLFVDAKAAMEAAPRVAQLMRAALHQSQQWEETQLAAFLELANGYCIQPTAATQPAPQLL